MLPKDLMISDGTSDDPPLYVTTLGELDIEALQQESPAILVPST